MYFASQMACCPAAFIWPELPPPESPHCVAQTTAARAADARAADDRAAINALWLPVAHALCERRQLDLCFGRAAPVTPHHGATGSSFALALAVTLAAAFAIVAAYALATDL